MGVAVAAEVFLLEITEQIFRERNVELVSLAAIAEVYAAVVLRSSLPILVCEISSGSFLQGGEFLIQLRGGDFFGDPPEGGGGINFFDVAGGNSQRRGRA